MVTALPDGPRNRLLSTIKVLRSPFVDLPRWLARYGDPFTIPTVNGTVVMTGDPALVKTIFAAPPSTYLPWGVDAVAPMLGPGSVLMLEGDRHTRERKLLMPPLHGERMRAHAQTMAEVARRHLAAADGASRVIAMDLMQAISLEVIARAIFGAQNDAQARALEHAVLDMIAAASPMLFFMPFLQRDFAGLGPWARFRRALAQLDGLLQERIDDARRHPRADLCGLLVAARDEDGEAMRDADIRDELRTMLFAGHETTAITLAWIIDLLHRHPEWLARVQAEIDALGPAPDPIAYTNLPTLDLVCKEVMRLYPIVTEVLRKLREPLRLGECEVPAGIGVCAGILLVHRNEALYPEPEAFRPERFAERRFAPHEYLPFGGGDRRCLGAAFASFEMRIVLGCALARHRISLLDETPPRPVRRNLTLAPGGGVPIRVNDRAGLS